MTQNPPAVSDESSFVVRRTIHVSAGADKVWQAITEPEHISRWFATTDLADDGRSGTMRFAEQEQTIPFVIVRQKPGSSITYRWNNGDTTESSDGQYDAELATEFTFTVQPTVDGTTLTVEESGFEATRDPMANLRSHTEGWTSELDKLVALMERTGASMDRTGASVERTGRGQA